MIEAKYSTFEQAKLLKEKGFDEVTDTIFMINHSIEVVFENINYLKHSDGNNPFVSRPEQWEIVEWLRVNHGIWIWVECYNNNDKFVPQIPKANLQKILGHFNSPQEAYSAAFDYVLNNLI